MHHSYKAQISVELKSLVYGYPKFIYSGNNLQSLDGIPVFVYHTIEPASFESQLQFLKRNGYKTLSIQEFHEAITNSKTLKNNQTVLLTIDDARSSVWRYAFPLLKKYQMHATVFVIPGLTEDDKSSRINLEDYWNDKCKLKEIHDVDINDNTLCTWQEIKEMYKSGFVNIESHTLFHREIFNSLKIINYITPDTPFLPYNFKGSPYYSTDDIVKNFSADNFIGLPLFESAPLMLAGPKLNISSEFIKICKEIFQDATKRNVDWKSSIKNIVKEESNKEKYFSVESSSRGIALQDLKMAREIIKIKLDNNAGDHLCLPWTIGNTETINILKELGIKSCFWGVLSNKKIIKPGDDPCYIPRIKNDFIFRLPGIGRKSLFSVYNQKVKRRIIGEKPF
jgi:hypothetical protein